MKIAPSLPPFSLQNSPQAASNARTRPWKSFRIHVQKVKSIHTLKNLVQCTHPAHEIPTYTPLKNTEVVSSIRFREKGPRLTLLGSKYSQPRCPSEFGHIFGPSPSALSKRHSSSEEYAPSWHWVIFIRKIAREIVKAKIPSQCKPLIKSINHNSLKHTEKAEDGNKKFWQRQNRRINYLLIIDHSCSEQLQPNIPAFPSLTDGPPSSVEVKCRSLQQHWYIGNALIYRIKSNTKSPTSTGVWSLWICCLCC